MAQPHGRAFNAEKAYAPPRSEGTPCTAQSLTRRSPRSAVPERIFLQGVGKKKGKKDGRGSPMSVCSNNAMDEDEPLTREMDTVYINLNKREDRRKLIQGEMRAQGLKGRRFPAKMGDDVPDSWVTRTWHSKLNCLYDKKTVAAEHKMSKGERGCSGSHIALWKQCARRDDPSKPMLILEDDAVLWERSGVHFPELCHRLIAAVEQVGARTHLHARAAFVHIAQRATHTHAHAQDPLPSPAERLSPRALAHARALAWLLQVWDVENEAVMLYVGCEVAQWRDSRRIVVDGPPVMKLREAEYLWQTSSYIIWPAAARMLLSRLPIDCPTDCYISKLVLEGYVTAVVATPPLAEQRDPYAKGDIKHTNTYKWQVNQ